MKCAHRILSSVSRVILAMSSEQAATVRRLRLFVVVLGLSNLLLGGAGFYFLRKIDQSSWSASSFW
jgi:hypothetical protein